MSPAVSEEDLDQRCREFATMMLGAIAHRKTVEIRLGAKPGSLVDARALSKAEDSLTELIRGLLSECDVALPDDWRLRIDILKAERVDDGNDDLILTLDFSKIFGPATEP